MFVLSAFSSFPLSLFALAFGAFSVGTTEFVILGLSPIIARDLQIGVAQAGLLVSSYAISVAVSTPVLALVSSRFSRKTALLGLLGVLVLGNILSALAHTYTLLLVSRVVAALSHGAFLGIGAVEAAQLVEERHKASAAALVFFGLMLANIVSVPLASILGYATCWQAPFALTAVLGVVALIVLVHALPGSTVPPHRDGTYLGFSKCDLEMLRHRAVWLSLLTAVVSSASFCSFFVYAAPFFRDVLGVDQQGVAWVLFLTGVGLAVGSVVGGKLADAAPRTSLVGVYVLSTLFHACMFWTMRTPLTASLSMVLWGLISFSAVPVLQASVVRSSRGTSSAASILNIGALNLGNALGAWVGGFFLSCCQMPLEQLPLLAACLSALALAAATGTAMRQRLSTEEPSRGESELAGAE